MSIKIGIWLSNYLDSKVHGANMGPIWGRQDPGGSHVGPINFAIWVPKGKPIVVKLFASWGWMFKTSNYTHCLYGYYWFIHVINAMMGWLKHLILMITSSNGPRWVPQTKASDAELWCLLWSAPEYTVECTIVRLVIWDPIAPIMTSS